MNEIQTFVRADRTLEAVVDQIGDDQWDIVPTADFPTAGDRDYTLRQILDYQAYDEAWIPTMMAGTTIDEAGADRFGDPIGNDLLGDAPKYHFAELVQLAIECVQTLDDSELDGRIVHYSYGDYPAREALWHAILFRAMRAHDIARAIGFDSELPADLVQDVWDIVEPHAEEWRQMGVFGPAVEVTDDAPLHDRLLAITGRRP
ncbi:hypothetical protein [Ilumatobacter sp.]|uniref:hypothetical protein n=1 Tax=Ilumatobacter sp. TaxID=1967498 RepID=UPI003C5DDA0F